MLDALFGNVSESEKNDAIEAIIQHASPRYDFFLMLALSLSMAIFGVLIGSTVILIGSMLIAPLLYPVLSLALGVIVSDEKLITRSLVTIGKSMALGLGAGLVIGFFFAGSVLSSGLPLVDVVASGSPSFMYVIVAAIAGFAAAFAVTKPHLSDTLPGVAIAVALVPPLAVAGIGLSLFNWTVMSNALLLFIVNAIGIMFSAMIVFALFRFSVKKTVAKEVVKEEEKLIKEETQTVVQ